MELNVGKYAVKLEKSAAVATVGELKKAYAILSKKSIHRLSFKHGDIRLEDDQKTLSSYGVASGVTLTFKDLGPQIGYRTVFLLEYFGPMVFVLLYATRPAIIYGEKAEYDPFHWVAKLAVGCW